MITIIATIKPQHLDNIRSGKKHYELRKTVPNVELPFRVLCCESGSGGKIKCEFICDHVLGGQGWRLIKQDGTCLTTDQIRGYVGDGYFYEWHISDMIDYCSTKGYRVRHISECGLTRPPQSWQYVKEDA